MARRVSFVAIKMQMRKAQKRADQALLRPDLTLSRRLKLKKASRALGKLLANPTWGCGQPMFLNF